jgi:hypothetical protein
MGFAMSQLLTLEQIAGYCNVIRDCVQLCVLGLKEVMQVIELGPDDVPVVIVRLGVEYVLISQRRRQHLDDTLPLSVGETDVG